MMNLAHAPSLLRLPLLKLALVLLPSGFWFENCVRLPLHRGCSWTAQEN